MGALGRDRGRLARPRDGHLRPREHCPPRGVQPCALHQREAPWGVGVWGLAFGARVWVEGLGLGFGVWGLGFGVWGLGFVVWGLGLGVWCLVFGILVLVVWCLVFGVRVVGCGV